MESPTASPEAFPGEYVDLCTTENGDLEIVLNEEGKREFSCIEELRRSAGTDAALMALLEDHLANEWEWLRPEEIGALTSAPILSDEVGRDDEGTVTWLGRVFWYSDYQIRDEIEELRERLRVVFQGEARPSE